MPDRPLLADREAEVLESLRAENVEALTPAERMLRGLAKTPEAEIQRRRALALSATGNLRNSHPWSAYLSSGRLKHVEDAEAIIAAENLRAGLEADRPEASAAEAELIRAAARAAAVTDIALAAAVRSGPFRKTKDGITAHPGLAVAAKFAGELRQTLALLGLGRRARSATNLADYLAQKRPASEPIPVEAVSTDDPK